MRGWGERAALPIRRGQPSLTRRGAASAEAALPGLTEARDTLTGLDATVSALPAEGKTALQALVSAALPALQTSADTLLADSAVAGVVKPVVDEILAKLRAFAA